MYYYILIFLISSTLLAGDFDFKPLPNWLFIAIIVFLIAAKIFIAKFVKNKVKNQKPIENKELIIEESVDKNESDNESVNKEK